MTVRTRFAPSPTGYIHLGNIRTALYAWLFARHHNGQFILRIEDTDQERSTEEATNIILESLKWLNLNWDEGPFYQAPRIAHYRAIADKMIEDGLAYRCYCPKERIDTLREKQLANKEKPRYDGHCRELNLPHDPTRPYVIRFKNPLTGEVSFDDQIRGHVSFTNEELDDLIIIRTDGFPTYNFSVVIDDSEMKISHVIRGADHINNTPRQINIFKALGAAVPTFAHLPMILGNDGKLLSKRHGAVNILQYRDEGFLPEAMLNYLVRLGWSHGDQEIFSRDEMIEFFDIKDINKAAAAFDIEKLRWLNRHYIKTLDVNYIAAQLQTQLLKLNIDIKNGPALKDLVLALRERADTLEDMANKAMIYFVNEVAINPEAMKHITTETLPILKTLQEKYAALTDWDEANIHAVVADVTTQFNVKMGKVAQPLRVAVTGDTFSPPIDITLKLIGQKRTLARLEKVLTK